jgi:hypothetical protein
MAFNSDKYIADLVAQGWSKSDAAASARYEAQAQAYIAANPTSAAANQAARASTEAYASPFSTAFGGTAPSTELDAARQYASPFSTAFGGTAPTFQSETTQQKSNTTTPPVVPPVSNISKDDMDAFAILERTFKDYGLEELVPAIKRYMSQNLGPNQATLLLRTEPEYIRRFKGNDIRRDSGLNALSESEYLALEDSYSQTLRAYGVQTYFGTDAKARQKAMSDIIGNDISATEFKDRIDTVVTRVTNADKQVKETLRTFYDIKDEDLTGYFLNPKENLPKLQEKVTAAEIGAAARSQNLTTGVTGATALAQFGITKEQAQSGYATIAEVMPTASKLGDIYGNAYTQNTAEQEVFKGTASAKRKRQQLAEQEVASFSGSSGRLRTGQTSGNAGTF